MPKQPKKTDHERIMEFRENAKRSLIERNIDIARKAKFNVDGKETGWNFQTGSTE